MSFSDYSPDSTIGSYIRAGLGAPHPTFFAAVPPSKPVPSSEGTHDLERFIASSCLEALYPNVAVVTADDELDALNALNYSVVRRIKFAKLLEPFQKSAFVEPSYATGRIDAAVPSQETEGWSDAADRIIVELGRLSPGWAGPGTHPPLREAIADLATAAGYLPSQTLPPEVEVDDDDGYITLCWWAPDESASFALIFNGKGEVIGTHSKIGGESIPPWKYAVGEESKIVREIGNHEVQRLIVRR